MLKTIEDRTFFRRKTLTQKQNNLTSIIEISPSILAGDFAHLADEAKRLEDSGANSIHIDIMDGHFVPNLTFGSQITAAINRSTDLFLDVHLMIYNPFDAIERFVEAGADRITFHLESTEEVAETLNYIRKCNVEAGLAFCPETSESLIPKYLDQCDLMLLMTVHPGFGGQEFMPEVLEKISFTRGLCDKLGVAKGGVTRKTGEPSETLPPFPIQVDGGINLETAKLCAEAGATSFVAGTHLYSQPDMKQAIASLRQAAEDGMK